MPFNAQHLHSDIYPDQGDASGRWYLARPLPDPLIWRIRQAWKVIKGEAEIIVWPDPNAGGEDG